MTHTKRNFLKIIGGGTILAAAGMGTYLSTRTPHKALEPWTIAGTYDDPRMQALSYALLAPNPHNRQPWLVDLSKPDQAIIWRDKERDLPFTDPYSRQLTIGMGCFLELMRIAASQSGHTIDLDLFPEGENGPVAIATFSEGAERDPLFDHVMDRRSCKEPFEDRPIPADLVTRLEALATVHSESAMVEKLRTLTFEAWETETNLPRTLKESVDLFRIGKSEINANPDGIDLGGPFLESLALIGVLTRESNLDPNSTAFAEGVRMYREMLMATPTYVVLTTPGNNRIDQIDAGERWLRLNLLTTSLGLALQPVSQCLQEFPEMRAHYQSAHALLAMPGETVQMLGRLGYGPKTARTPRWPLESRLVNARSSNG